jgi:hypothetical protein
MFGLIILIGLALLPSPQPIEKAAPPTHGLVWGTPPVTQPDKPPPDNSGGVGFLPPMEFPPPTPVPIVGPPGADPNCRFEWDYEKNPLVAEFRIFASKTSGTYKVDGLPVAEIQEITQWTTTDPCIDAHILDAGTYYLVIYAVSYTGEMSEPSNEITGCVARPGGEIRPC